MPAPPTDPGCEERDTITFFPRDGAPAERRRQRLTGRRAHIVPADSPLILGEVPLPVANRGPAQARFTAVGPGRVRLLLAISLHS
jgi:hypothetical protein